MENNKKKTNNLIEITETRKDRVLVVGLKIGQDKQFDHSMEELISLCEACHMEVVCMITQSLPTPHKALYIGTGKVDEVRETAALHQVDLIIFDNALSPSQIRNLNASIGLPILDRTALILEIFHQRAQTKEANLQVDLARLQYLLPRLAGMGTALSRQGGTSGSMSSRGAGEKKLELDRRHIELRIGECRKELEAVKRNRETQRKSRSNSSIPQVSLVGYTNAGKSTLMNKMLSLYGNSNLNDNEHKLVFEKDMVFATLETTVRKITPEGKHPFYLSDTVGFINKLPHNLVDAFRSTLEEVCLADLLVQVVDASDEHYKEHIRITNETLNELGAGHIPMLLVYNKCDRLEEIGIIPRVQDNKIHMSAKKEIGMNQLLDLILKELYKENTLVELLLPYSEGGLLNTLTKEASILEQEYRDQGTYVKVEVNPLQLSKLQPYLLDTSSE